ncbi:MAG: cation:proton antiporter [Eubacteriales bacterium]
MATNIIFIVAISVLGGLLFGRLAKFMRLPNVTGYLIAGLVLGPCVLNIISESMVNDFTVVSDMALGFIAFTIGIGFKLNYFKEVGMAPIIIAITESFGAIIFIIVTLLLLGFDPALSILLGAIAAATAPAQTIMVIKQYHAKGPVTSMLLSVVALDDAVALIGFGFAVTIVKVISSHAVITILSVLQPLYEIGVSLVLGVALALFMKLLLRWFKKARNRACITTGVVLLAIWLADLINASPLLTCMALGGVLTNIFADIESIIEVTDSFTPPIYVMFFLMSGAGFDVKALAGIGLLGVLYIVLRVAGKMVGAWFGGKITKSDPNICKHLGPTLMPQAGVAIGLILVASELVPEYAKVINVVILCSTFVYSIIGPSVAKSALVKSGEIVLPDKEKKHRKGLKDVLLHFKSYKNA